MTRVRMTLVAVLLAATWQPAAADLADRMAEIRRIAPPDPELSEPVWLEPASTVQGPPNVAPVAMAPAPLRSIETVAVRSAPAPVSESAGQPVHLAPVVPGVAAEGVVVPSETSQAPWYYGALDWIENLGMDNDCSCSADGYPCPQHIKKHHARYYPCTFPGYLPMWGYVPTRWRPFPEPGRIGPPLGPEGEILYEIPAGAPQVEHLPRPAAP